MTNLYQDKTALEFKEHFENYFDEHYDEYINTNLIKLLNVWNEIDVVEISSYGHGIKIYLDHLGSTVVDNWTYRKFLFKTLCCLCLDKYGYYFVDLYNKWDKERYHLIIKKCDNANLVYLFKMDGYIVSMSEHKYWNNTKCNTYMDFQTN